MFSLLNFSSIFPGGLLTPFAPMYGRPCTWHGPHSPAARRAAVRRAAIDRYLLPAKFAAVAFTVTDRRTDGQTDSAPHTERATQATL